MAMATILAYSLPVFSSVKLLDQIGPFGKLIVIPAIALTLTSLIGILVSAGLTSLIYLKLII